MNSPQTLPKIEDFSPEIDQKLSHEENVIKFRENLPINPFFSEAITQSKPSFSDQHLSSKSKPAQLSFPSSRNDTDPIIALPRTSNNFFLASVFSSKREQYRTSYMNSQGESPKGKDSSPKAFGMKVIELKTSQNRNSKSFFNVISDIYLCRKFINTLLNLTALRKTKWLNCHHFELINDQSHFQQETSQVHKKETLRRSQTLRTVWQNLTVGLSKLLNENKLIAFSRLTVKSFLNFIEKHSKTSDPTKICTIIWDILIMAIILYFFIVIPLEFSFYNDFCEIPFPYFRELALIILLLDMIKSMNTAYYNKGTLVTDRREIMIKYMTGSLIVDLITMVPLWIDFYLGRNHNYLAFLNALFFFKYFHFKRIRDRLEEFAIFDENFLALVKLLFRILLFSHIFACLWFYIGTTSKNSWIALANLEKNNWVSDYIHSFYFIIVTMNTVGFGDIRPNNNTEVIFVILFIFVGCGLFAVNLNQIGLILSNLSKNSKEYHKELNLLNQFMMEKNINFELRTKIRKYLQYIWKEENLEQFGKQVKIINKLSDSLKTELLIEANGPFLRDLKLFNLNFSEETLRETVNIMIEKRFTPGDLIFSQNDINHKSLYIIRKGKIELFNENSELLNSIKILGPGDTFAETTFFSAKSPCFSARSADFSNVFVIKQEDFLQILNKNKKDLERFCQIKDNINLYEDYGDLFLRCVSCLEPSHLVKDCPLLHYIPKREIVILKHIYSQDQARKRRFRNRTKKTHAFIIKSKINRIIERFQREIMRSSDTLSQEDHIISKETDLYNIEKCQTSEILECEEEDENLNKKDEESKKYSDNDKTKKTEKSYQKCSFGNDCESSYEKDKDHEYSSSFNHNSNSQMRNSSANSQKSQANLFKNNLTLDVILHALLEKAKSEKNLIEKTNNNNNNNEKIMIGLFENYVEIDQIKSFDFYFPYDNIESVLNRVGEITSRKRRKSKSTYRNKNSDKKNNEEPSPVRLLENSPFQKKFFKNKSKIEKLIQEEKFDRLKFKERFRENLEKNNKKRSKFFKMVDFFFEKTSKKTVLSLKRKRKNSLQKSKINFQSN